MLKFALVAALIASALFAVKKEHVLQHAGLLGSCEAIVAPVGKGGEWHACRAGKLTGPPDLSRDSCKRAGVLARVEYWVCPARVSSVSLGGWPSLET